MMWRVLFTLGLCLTAGSVLAATDDFNISLFVGSDTTPPTTPEFISVTPVAETQIDLVWTAATDDVLLSGYRLFRDGLQIATTTLTSYSDTGLLASTTYEYTVDAYDHRNNISSTSLPVATTTLFIPPATTTPVADAPDTSSYARARISSLDIAKGQVEARFAWVTNVPARYILRWGRTSSYELGTISGGVFKRQQATLINQLEAGTEYYYELSVINNWGATGEVKTGRFSTTALETIVRPPNAALFTAIADRNDSVALSWQNPTYAGFAYVRVVRSHLFYPTTPYEGALIYEGTGQSVLDKGALKERSPQYYTIFVYDQRGNLSSGAVAAAYRIETAGTSSIASEPKPEVEARPDPTPPVFEAPAEVGDNRILSAGEVRLIQGSVVTTFLTNVTLFDDVPYTVSILKSAVPDHLKSIIFSVQDPSDNRQVSAYLLRLSPDGDSYEALIPPPNVSGRARGTLEVFDYNAATLRRISNSILFVENDEAGLSAVRPAIYSWFLIGIFILILGIVIGLFWWFLGRREREDN